MTELEKLLAEQVISNGYGYCPKCGAVGVSRERRLDGNDICGKGHTYPSILALDSCLTSREEKLARICHELKEALNLISDENRDDGTGSIITNRNDRLGYPVITHYRDIASEALTRANEIAKE